MLQQFMQMQKWGTQTRYIVLIQMVIRRKNTDNCE